LPILSGTDTQPQLSVAALETLWVQNGGSQATAPQAAAVATAESSRVPDNTNVNTDGSVDYGLFQINTVQNPAFAGQVNPDNVEQSAIFIPNVNVADAESLSSGGANWGPWSSSEFTPGNGWGVPGTPAYAIAQAGYQGGAVTPAVSGSSTSSSNATTPAAGTTTTTTTTTPYDPTGIVSEISHIGSDWTTFWTNHPVAILIAAGIVLIIAIAFIASDKGVQGAATKVAATAAEAG
jgi:hypothetical protein